MLFKSHSTKRVEYRNKTGDKIYPVMIDIKRGVTSSEPVSFMTADINTGILSVAFMEGEQIYSTSGATVLCEITRPDGTELSIGANIVSDGIVEVPLGVNGTSQAGIYTYDFKIVRPGNKTIGVPVVSYIVSQSINTSDIVEEDDRLPILQELIINIQNTTNNSNVATTNCITATNNANTATESANKATTDINNAMQSIKNAIASGTVDLELKQIRTSLDGTTYATANDRINALEQKPYVLFEEVIG